jgi:hypothetical protein
MVMFGLPTKAQDHPHEGSGDAGLLRLTAGRVCFWIGARVCAAPFSARRPARAAWPAS